MKLPVKEHLISLERIPNRAEKREEYLHLEKNENLIPFSERFLKELRQAISADFLSSYPELTPLYESIAEWIGCGKGNVYLTAGSDAAIKTVFEVFVRPQDKVAILHPTYAMYYVYGRMFQARLLEIDCLADLTFSTEEILQALEKERPRLLCLANPNSPTGKVISARDLESIIKRAERSSTIVLIDEAYGLYYSSSAVGLTNKYPNLVVTRTFSKALGLASARIGCAVGSLGMIGAFLKVRPMYEVNAIGAKFAEILLSHPEVIERNVRLTKQGKKYLEGGLDKLGLKYFKSRANFILVKAGSFEQSAMIVKEMKERGILIGGPFKHRYLKNCVRVTVGSKEQMKRLLKELIEVLKAAK